MQPGESPEQALARECTEGIGVTVTRWRALDPPVVRLGEGLELYTFVVDAWRGTPAGV
ncbi:NUDIX domain-containing protein [Janibacter indicus]|uniref:NUDIX domain-containing protein n=1 Tax=Janibacter indicus TaxID=857417 RepID=A0A7L9J716_9MICO|nr:NUDIX domain-containing protein [Janibacter indicus]QOK24470.1 NUDIX domain-containing protein [Janibacter indicus]